MSTKVFYFIAQMGDRWREIMRDQLNTLRSSGLEEAAETIFLCIGSGPKSQKIKGLPAKYHQVYFSRLNQFEFPALRMVKEYTALGDKVLYFHTKGVSRTGHHTVPGDKWRKYLDWGCIERWREHVAALDSHDLSGVQLTNLDRTFRRRCGAAQVYAGNYWWANGDHIARLPWAEVLPNRWAAEGWVMQTSPAPRCHDLHNLTGGKEITCSNAFYLPEFSRKSYDPDYVEHVPLMVQTRHEIINALIQARKYRRYLEIGVWRFDCFRHVKCELKECVDPGVTTATYPMTSDAFFHQNKKQYDIIFIDGLHTAEQVAKDIDNALKCLAPGGAIVLHDCNPETNFEQRDIPEYDGKGIWVGTVWKAFARMRMTRPDLSMRMIDADFGCGIIERGRQECFPLRENIDYPFFVQNREALMNVVAPEEFRP
jgi:hypothetical protein